MKATRTILGKRPFLPLAILSAGLIGGSGLLNAASLQITGVISQTAGTTTDVSTGTDANTTTWSVGTVGSFEMNNGAYYMRVSATNPTGALANTTPAAALDSLMVARTTNSQGLVDTGTLSILVRPTPNAANTNPQSLTAWTLDVNFSFFTDVAMTIPTSVPLLLTSLDIDFGQRYYTKNSTFSANVVANNTNLIPASAIVGYTGYTTAPTASAAFNDPKYAVSSVASGSSLDLRLAHVAQGSNGSVALFMFEFRDPSAITGLVPEPSAALLGGLGLLGLLRRRRA